MNGSSGQLFVDEEVPAVGAIAVVQPGVENRHSRADRGHYGRDAITSNRRGVHVLPFVRGFEGNERNRADRLLVGPGPLPPPKHHGWYRKSQIERQIGSDLFVYGTRRRVDGFIWLLGWFRKSFQASAS